MSGYIPRPVCHQAAILDQENRMKKLNGSRRGAIVAVARLPRDVTIESAVVAAKPR